MHPPNTRHTMHIPYTPPNCTQHSTTQQQTLYNTALTTLFNFAISVSGYSRNQESEAEKEARRREGRRENKTEKQAWRMQLVCVQHVWKQYVWTQDEGIEHVCTPCPAHTHPHLHTLCNHTHASHTHCAPHVLQCIHTHKVAGERTKRPGRRKRITGKEKRMDPETCVYVHVCISAGWGGDLLIEGSLDFDSGDVVKGDAWLICLRLLQCLCFLGDSVSVGREGSLGGKTRHSTTLATYHNYTVPKTHAMPQLVRHVPQISHQWARGHTKRCPATNPQTQMFTQIQTTT